MSAEVVSNGSAIAVIEPVSNSLEANVGVLMRRATDVAGVCRDIVTKTAQSIQGRKYVRVEGWQSIAVAYGCAASARDVESVYDNAGKLAGVRAIGEVRRMSDGVVIAAAEGYVGVDEPTWFGGTDAKGKKFEPRPMYAIRAMTQTRAVSRACRSAFSFVVTLIDEKMSTTPFEEMDGVIVEGSATPPAPRGVGGLKSALSGPPPSPPHTVAAAVEQHADRPAPTHDRDASFGFGKNKGVILADLDEGSLKWYAACLQRDLDDAGKAQWHDKTRKQLANLNAEMRHRGI